MTGHSPEFLEQYPKNGFGVLSSTSTRKPDYTRCAGSVRGEGNWPSYHQCTRKNGHGPHGAWCKQHDPEAVKAKIEARNNKWRREWDGRELDAALRAEALTIIRQIAEGHNDPASLCRDWCARWDSK